MRVKIKNSELFFDNLRKGKSLRLLSKKYNISYGKIKRWYRGKNTIDKKNFDYLLNKIENKEEILNNINILNDTWGCSKGGKNTARKLGKLGLKIKLKKVRRYKRKGNYRNFNPTLNEGFCEFYGALMGDGCISKYKKSDGYNAYDIVIVGDKYKDKEYHLYLKKLIEKELNVYTKVWEIKNKNCRKITIKSRGLFEFLNNLGFPIGIKGERLKIPKRLINLNWDINKNVIKGIFDTDGCISAKKHEKYKYPYIIITSISNKLLFQLFKLFKEHNYPFYLRKRKNRLIELLMRGNKNVIRWMEDIGSNNPKHIIKYEYWKKYGVLPSNVNWADRLTW